MSSRRLVAVALACASLFSAGIARAESDLLSRAEELLRQAASTRQAAARFHLADEAQALAEQAARKSPRSAEPHLALARALNVSDPDHPERCRPGACERATDELHRARALDSGGALASTIAQELGLALSRLRRYPEALAEYDRAIGLIDAERLPNLWDDPGSRSILFSNSAETLMALGRLGEAIDRYRRARDLAEPGSLEWQLAEWGLGLALDRDEQLDKAAESIRHVIDVDPTMSHLSDDNVFFEPPGDVYYYRALGHEAAGDRELALSAWRDYLASAPPARWARRARAHLAEVRRGPAGNEPDPERLQVRFGEPETFADLRPAAELREGLGRYQDDVRLCYARALKTAPHLRGELSLGLEIWPSGAVYPDARVFDDRLGPAAAPLERCLERAARSWHFPSIGGIQPETVRIRIELAPAP